MVKCPDCKKEMHGSTACTVKYIKIDGVKLKRDTTYYDNNKTCHDCGIKNKVGNVHHFGCDIERCPKCGDQLISCECKNKKLV